MDNDSDIDINDATWLIYTYGWDAADGGCAWDGTRDADFSNNGTVGTGDYTFFTGNWLAYTSCTCTTRGMVLGNVRTSLMTSELEADVAAAVDLNRDGVVDHRDVRVFEDRHGLGDALSSKMRVTARPPAGSTGGRSMRPVKRR